MTYARLRTWADFHFSYELVLFTSATHKSLTPHNFAVLIVSLLCANSMRAYESDHWLLWSRICSLIVSNTIPSPQKVRTSNIVFDFFFCLNSCTSVGGGCVRTRALSRAIFLYYPLRDDSVMRNQPLVLRVSFHKVCIFFIRDPSRISSSRRSCCAQPCQIRSLYSFRFHDQLSIKSMIVIFYPTK